jgi:preprotein translocase subunit YajC
MTAFTAFLTFLAADTPPAAGPQAFFDKFGSFTMPLALVVMFYFLLIRPQQRQRKDMEARIASLQPGSKVVTSSGIYALVHSVKDRSVILKVAEGTMIEFEKSAIASVQPKESADAKK